MQGVLQAYKKNGFASAWPQALTRAEVDELASLSNQAFATVRDASSVGESHPKYFPPTSGAAGDIAFFFNRTWHGRARNSSSQSFDVILISFFPAGAAFGFKGYGDWSPEFLTSLQGTRLEELIDPAIGTHQRSDGLYEILPSGKVTSRELPFSLAIDDGHIPRAGAGGVNLLTTITILRSVFAVGRPLRNLARNFVPRGKQ